MLLLVALIVLVALTWVYMPIPVRQWIEMLRLWVSSLGALGVVLFVVLYVVFTLVLGPITGLNLVAGLVYGAWGFPLVVLCATAGASLAFLLARYAAQSRVNRWIATKPMLLALQQAVSDEGWRVVALIRLSPVIPFGLQNYLFAVTHIRLLPFVLATFFGVMPSIALQVYVGALGQDIGKAGIWQLTLVVAGLATTALVAWVVARRTRHVLEKQAHSGALENLPR